MADNKVTISGMFGEIDGQVHTYFIDSPVVIDISGLYWGDTVTSPFTVVRVEVIYEGEVVGMFQADTGGQTSISFDISSALRAIWSGYPYDNEVSCAQAAARGTARDYYRGFRRYSLIVYTDYLASDGNFTATKYGPFTGGACAIGGFTEWERSTIPHKEDADVSYREHENLRNGDASTKPTDTLERVGSISPTSWVDVNESETTSIFYPSTVAAAADQQGDHAPLVLRDSQPYVDFLFVNRRGAVETCSGQTLESMNIKVNTTQYSRKGRPSFNPERSLMAFGADGRRWWTLSSGFVTREWAEWWTMEFLGGKRKKWWMRYPIGDVRGTYIPVTIQPSKQDTLIYDRSKQEMPHVEFTVTLALEG